MERQPLEGREHPIGSVHSSSTVTRWHAQKEAFLLCRWMNRQVLATCLQNAPSCQEFGMQIVCMVSSAAWRHLTADVRLNLCQRRE
eukprot:7389121-Prymnesium_polylepis.1